MRYHEDIETRFTARHKACIEFSGDVKDRVVLDVGCWIGWYEKFMIEKGCNFIVGMDLDRNALCEAKKSVSADRCEFVCASAYKLPFKLGGFDVVSMFDVLEHLPAGSEFDVLSEANRVLNANGLLVVSVPNNHFIIKLLDPAYFLVGHRHYALDGIRGLLEKMGFNTYEVKYGGGVGEALSMVLLYLFKHLFCMEVPFKSFLGYLRNKEYQGKGFATLFIKAERRIMLDKKTDPLVSIVVINYNAKEYLESCLNSVLNSDYPNFEVIIVDNGSEDGSLEFLEEISKSKPNINVIKNEENLGPSAARNQGIKIAKGKYVAFLDNDTRVRPLWLKEAIKVFEADPKIGACQCKLILDDTDNIIDCVGEYLGQYGFLVHVVTPGEEKDVGQYDIIIEIFAAKSAGMIARKDVLNKIGGFDDDYFIYMEESDLCWRIWLLGYKVTLIPNSIVYHRFGASSVVLPEKINYLVKFHGTKNYISSLIKNFGLWNLVKVLPLNLSLWSGMAVWYVLKRRLIWATYIVKGILYNLVYFKRIWEKRLRVQYLIRKVPDNYIMPRIMKKTSFSYFYNKFMRPKVGWRT